MVIITQFVILRPRPSSRNRRHFGIQGSKISALSASLPRLRMVRHLLGDDWQLLERYCNHVDISWHITYIYICVCIYMYISVCVRSRFSWNIYIYICVCVCFLLLRVRSVRNTVFLEAVYSVYVTVPLVSSNMASCKPKNPMFGWLMFPMGRRFPPCLITGWSIRRVCECVDMGASINGATMCYPNRWMVYNG